MTTATAPPLAGLRILAMPSHLEGDVRDLYHQCHPKWPALPAPYLTAYPTLVAIGDYPANVVGYAQYAINMDDGGHLALWLKDTGVSPEARGQGIARALMLERLRIGREMGCLVALGMTHPKNTPMLALLRSLHFEERETIKRAYPDGKSGIFFGLPLRGEH